MCDVGDGGVNWQRKMDERTMFRQNTKRRPKTQSTRLHMPQHGKDVVWQSKPNRPYRSSTLAENNRARSVLKNTCRPDDLWPQIIWLQSTDFKHTLRGPSLQLCDYAHSLVILIVRGIRLRVFNIENNSIRCSCVPRVSIHPSDLGQFQAKFLKS